MKYLVRGRGWTGDNRFANVIIDDPPLKAKYGFIDFRRLSQRALDRHLCFTLAFIPWNFRRGRRRALQLFQQSGDHLSLCVHGCNHTRREFGIADQTRLDGLASLACERMDALARRTGIPYQRIMVFPQGILSAEAMLALKRNHYLAAVNTEVLDVTGKQCLTLRDMLQPAVTAYHGFPVFLRRKVEDGIENIAFDLLLGKPAIVVTHHEDYYSDDAPVWRLTEAITNLHAAPQWRPLTDVLSNTVRYRETSEGEVEAVAYTNTVSFAQLPTSWRGRALRVIKREPEPDMIERVSGSEPPPKWSITGGNIAASVAAGWEDGEMRVAYKRQVSAKKVVFGLKERLSIRMLRALSEIRDNWVTTTPILKRLVAVVRK